MYSSVSEKKPFMMVAFIKWIVIFLVFVFGLYTCFKTNMHAIIPFIAGITVILLAGYVYSKNRNSVINRTFSLFTVCIGISCFSIYGTYIAPDEVFVDYWVRIFATGLMFKPVTCFQFILAITHNRDKIFKTILRIAMLCAGIFSVLLWSGQMIGQYVKTTWKYSPDASPVYLLFLIYLAVVLLYSLIILFTKYKNTRVVIERNQLKYVFLAGFVGLLIGFTNIFLSFGIKVYPFGSLGYIAFSGIIAYAIVRHQLMDISVIIKKSIVYFTLTAIITAVYAVIVGVFHGLLDIPQTGRISFVVDVLIIITIAFVILPLRNRIQMWVDRLFFRDKYDYHKTLVDFSGALGSVIELNKLLNLMLETVMTTMHIDKSSIMLLDEDQKKFNMKVLKGMDRKIAGKLDFSDSSYLSKWLMSNRSIFVVETIKYDLRESRLSVSAEDKKALEDTLATLEETGISLVIPFIVKDKLTGMFNLGNKMSEEDYSTGDIELLMTVANQAAVAIENAKLYSDISQLEKNLYHADKLSALGTMAASVVHEVRTPIAALTSFCQMAPRMYKEPGFWDRYEDTVTRELERLNGILERLLNYGKPSPEGERLDRIQKILDEILLLVNKELIKHNVEVSTEYGTNVPDIMMPSDGLKQVFMNIILNAVHAMPEGGVISISLNRVGSGSVGRKQLQIEIEDNGTGINENTLNKVFKPFFTTRKEGTGLGLPICKKIVNDYGGVITVNSEVGKGTVFTVKIPIK